MGNGHEVTYHIKCNIYSHYSYSMFSCWAINIWVCMIIIPCLKVWWVLGWSCINSWNHKMMRFMEQKNASFFIVHSVLNKIRHVSLQYFLCSLSLSLEYFHCSATKEGTVQSLLKMCSLIKNAYDSWNKQCFFFFLLFYFNFTAIFPKHLQRTCSQVIHT